MRKIYLVILFSLSIALFYGNENSYGFLYVKIDSNDYDIYIDETFVGKQNEQIKVLTGLHYLEIKLKDEVILNKEIIVFENMDYEIKELKSDAGESEDKRIVNNNIGSGFYLFGIIFPLSNLFGITYFGHGLARNYSRPFYIMHAIWYYIPLVTSTILFLTSSVMFPISSWYYKFDFNNFEYNSYFKASMILFGLSYLINLIMGIFYISYSGFYQGETFFEKRNLNFDINCFDDKINIMINFKI